MQARHPTSRRLKKLICPALTLRTLASAADPRSTHMEVMNEFRRAISAFREGSNKLRCLVVAEATAKPNCWLNHGEEGTKPLFRLLPIDGMLLIQTRHPPKNSTGVLYCIKLTQGLLSSPIQHLPPSSAGNEVKNVRKIHTILSNLWSSSRNPCITAWQPRCMPTLQGRVRCNGRRR